MDDSFMLLAMSDVCLLARFILSASLASSYPVKSTAAIQIEAPTRTTDRQRKHQT